MRILGDGRKNSFDISNVSRLPEASMVFYGGFFPVGETIGKSGRMKPDFLDVFCSISLRCPACFLEQYNAWVTETLTKERKVGFLPVMARF